MTQGEATLCQFALQALDPVMDYPVLEARFEIEDLSGLRVILADDAEGDHDLRCGYTLDIDQLAAIRSLCDVAFDPGDRPVVLAPWHSIREAPYLVHTGFELPLMLDGRKPLSRFADAYRRSDGAIPAVRERGPHHVPSCRRGLANTSPAGKPTCGSWTSRSLLHLAGRGMACRCVPIALRSRIEDPLERHPRAPGGTAFRLRRVAERLVARPRRAVVAAC
jgi:hypothetical protein